MYYTQVSLMIGGTKEKLEIFIQKLSLNEFLVETRIFPRFKLVHIDQDFWIWGFCHHHYEWDAQEDFALTEIEYEAKLFELPSDFVFSNRCPSRSDFSPLDPGDYEPERPERAVHFDRMQELIDKRLVFDPVLKTAFAL